MKKLAILLVVLAMCLPVYGYVLVYKVTMSGPSANFETDDPNGWLLEKGSASGYLVLDVDDSDPNILNDMQFVDYYTKKVDKKPTKLYDIWIAGGDFAQSILPGPPPKRKNITIVTVDLSSQDTSFLLSGLLLGTNSLTDIGTLDVEEEKTKVDVATTLKGSCWFISGENMGDVNEIIDELGTGTFSATLDSKWTKTANDPNVDTKGFAGDIGSFLAPESGPFEGDHAPRGLVNWLQEVQKYQPLTD